MIHSIIKSTTSASLNESLMSKTQLLNDDINRMHAIYFSMNEQLRPILLDLYDNNFRFLEIEIQRKALECSEIQRRAELLMMKSQRGEKLTPQIIALVHKVVDKEYLNIKSRLHQAFQKYTKKVESSSIENVNEQTVELNKKYRELVKILHPDKALNQELTKQYWHILQNAFEEKNVSTVRALYSLIKQQFHSQDEHKQTVQSHEELVRLEAVRDDLLKKIDLLKKQVPFIYELGLRDQTWLANHKATLESQILKYQENIHKAQYLIKLATGMAWEYLSKPLDVDANSDSKSTDYQKDFIDTTYFSGKH